MNSVKEYIVVTGANAGIGHAITEYLAKNHFYVIATARKQSEIDKLNKIPNVLSTYLDIRDQNSISEFGLFVEKRKLKIKALVNNAGVIKVSPIMLFDYDQILETFQSNLFGHILVTRLLLPFLIQSKGRIINIGSDSGISTFPNTVLYSMTKYAIEAFTEGLREELKSFGITVSVILPGNHNTSIFRNTSNELNDLEKSIDNSDLKKQFLELKPKLLDAINELNNASDPRNVAKKVMTILQKKKPLTHYFVGQKEELDYLINTLLDKITEINFSSDIKFNKQQLIDKLEFSLDLFN